MSWIVLFIDGSYQWVKRNGSPTEAIVAGKLCVLVALDPLTKTAVYLEKGLV